MGDPQGDRKGDRRGDPQSHPRGHVPRPRPVACGGDARFGRAMRLAGPRRFKRVFAEGVRSHSAGFTVLALGNGGSRARLGLAVARKHLRRAVDRNRVKRRVRESFRRHQRALGGLDVVVMTRPSLARCQPGKIDAMLQSHWSDIVRRAARARVARSD